MKAGANIECVNSEMNTPLYMAAGAGHAHLIPLLLSHGANKGAADCVRFTPLHRAIKQSHDVAALALIAAGSPLEARSEVGGTPLHIAARGGRCRVLQVGSAIVFRVVKQNVWCISRSLRAKVFVRSTL
jgi:ankyrin repeat protein